MSNLSFTLKVKRIAIIDPKFVKGQILPVGEVEEYSRTDTEIKVNVRLAEELPKELQDQIEKNPGCVKISEVHEIDGKPLIIPSRPKLVL